MNMNNTIIDHQADDGQQVVEKQLASVRKRRQKLEAELLKIKQQDMMDVEELKVLEEEISAKDAAVQKSQKKLAEAKWQLSKAEVCRTMESARSEARLKATREHHERFNVLFARERRRAEVRFRRQREKEREQHEREREHNEQKEKQSREQIEMTVAVEAECDQLERECAVLKKRNAAILLLLRKNLFDAETRRRSLMGTGDPHEATN